MAKYKKTLITIALFLGLQIVVTSVFAVVAVFRNTTVMDYMAPALLISDALSILVLWVMKYYQMKEFSNTVPGKVMIMSLILGFFAFWGINILTMPFDVPDYFEEIFIAMSKSFTGFLAICIIGPVMEEIMMRRIILTEVAQATGKKWLGIIISAAIFAAIHGNPIQIIFAMPAGILLGWLYCKTGSLLVPVCVHIMNNTCSFISMKFPDVGTTDFHSPLTMAELIICIIISVYLIIRLVSYYSGIEKQQQTETVGEPLQEPAVQEKEPAAKGVYNGDNYEK